MLLFRGDLLDFGQFRFKILEYCLCGRHGSQFEQDLEQEEERFDLQEFFNCFLVLEYFVQIGEGAPVLLSLVAEHRDVVKEGEIAI